MNPYKLEMLASSLCWEEPVQDWETSGLLPGHERVLSETWNGAGALWAWWMCGASLPSGESIRQLYDCLRTSEKRRKAWQSHQRIPLSVLHMSHPILSSRLCAFVHRNPAAVSVETHTLTYAAAIRLNDKAFLDRDGREEKMLRELELSRMISW